jgi:Rap1a immunity proteins
MKAFLIRTLARGFAQMITVIGAPRLMRVVIWAGLIVSASEAAAQLPAADTSANAIFRGCKAFVEGRAADAQLYGLGNYCAGIVIGLASAAQDLSRPEWQSCAPATTNAQQLARVVVDFIEAHPDRTHEDFKRLTLEAFHDAWPCKSGR